MSDFPIALHGARVGARGEGLKNFLTILDGGRISVAALSVGLARGAYDESVKYAKERHAFGKPISKFQAIAFKIVDMITEIEHAELMVLRAAWEKDQGRDFVRSASYAKLYSAEVSRRVVNDAVQIHGGYGFMDEYPVSRMYRDQKIAGRCDVRYERAVSALRGLRSRLLARDEQSWKTVAPKLLDDEFCSSVEDGSFSEKVNSWR